MSGLFDRTIQWSVKYTCCRDYGVIIRSPPLVARMYEPSADVDSHSIIVPALEASPYASPREFHIS